MEKLQSSKKLGTNRNMFNFMLCSHEHRYLNYDKG